MNRWRVGEDIGSKEMDRCPLTDLPTNFLGAFTLTNFWYGLAGSLGIYAQFAESWFGW
jgi:hypothetical protein